MLYTTYQAAKEGLQKRMMDEIFLKKKKKFVISTRIEFHLISLLKLAIILWSIWTVPRAKEIILN